MTVQAIVSGVDSYSFVDETGYHWAMRGDVIEVAEEEFARVPGALSVPDAEAPTEPSETEEEAAAKAAAEAEAAAKRAEEEAAAKAAAAKTKK